jgi:hypothetical protein
MSRTFIRGQNAPVEPEVLLERERKRQKALEHQNAIRLQVTSYSWMISSPYAFLTSKVLIIRPNSTYRYNTTDSHYILQHVSAVQISHHKADARYTKKNIYIYIKGSQ